MLTVHFLQSGLPIYELVHLKMQIKYYVEDDEITRYYVALHKHCVKRLKKYTPYRYIKIQPRHRSTQQLRCAIMYSLSSAINTTHHLSCPLYDNLLITCYTISHHYLNNMNEHYQIYYYDLIQYTVDQYSIDALFISHNVSLNHRCKQYIISGTPINTYDWCSVDSANTFFSNNMMYTFLYKLYIFKLSCTMVVVMKRYQYEVDDYRKDMLIEGSGRYPDSYNTTVLYNHLEQYV